MLVILPVSLAAQDNASAILRSNGGVLLNKNPAPNSSALYRDDLIETQKGVVAQIEASGSTAYLNTETMVQFEETELALDHGRLSVYTSHGLKVRIGCLMVAPVNGAAWTRYEVADLDGKVTVTAVESDVYIDSGAVNVQQANSTTHSSRITVREGEQKSRDEKCGAREIKESDRLPGKGAILNSPWVIGAGIISIGVLTCWALCRSGVPLSPVDP
jgi:hypothetical protein